MSKPIIITISGSAQHGKDSSATIIKGILEENEKRVLIIAYANYLKYIAKQYFDWDGNKDEKGRTLLQRLGTEKVRAKYPNFWVDSVIDIVKILEDDFDYVLIPDCRFRNEVNRWEEEGYHVLPIHVYRPDFDNGLTEEQKNHPSETALNGFQFSVYLAATNLVELERDINDQLFKDMRGCDAIG